MKYKVEVGSFCTRFVKRIITVHADNETEASEKAINKFIDMEMKLANYSDFGSPQADSVEKLSPEGECVDEDERRLYTYAGSIGSI